MAESRCRHLFVRSPDGQITGVVSDDDLLSYLSRNDAADAASWKTRSVEAIMSLRFRLQDSSHSGSSGGSGRAGVADGDTLDGIRIVEDGRLVAVQTKDDLLLSWSQLQPLIRSATTDELTTLANRSMFQHRLTEELERSTRHGEPLALLLLDIDHFKAINDSLGHLAGDAVLAEFGACLRRTLRLYDIIARFGGDEFAAVCCNCEPSSIDAPIRRLLSAVHELPLPSRQTIDRISISIGAVVVTDGFEQLSIDALIDAADDCLYASKQAGRNCAHVATLNEKSEPTLIRPCEKVKAPSGLPERPVKYAAIATSTESAGGPNR